jgi:transcriptional regulator with XRE-family HTH domain
VDPVRIGHQVRALRRRRGWRQDDLAAASRVSRATIARVELGGAAGQKVQMLEKIGAALSARLDARLLWNGESLDRLLDEAHASIVNELSRRLIAAAWDVAPEVSFSIFGERGSIDLLAFHSTQGLLLVVEVKSALPDLQAMLVTLDRKARLAPRIAQDRGWRAGSSCWRATEPRGDASRRTTPCFEPRSRRAGSRSSAGSANPTSPSRGCFSCHTFPR